MTEQENVAVVSDNGQKRRWGIGQYVYRQDGKKLTVNGKGILAVVAVAFVCSSTLVLVRGPTQLEFRSPIRFEGIVSNQETIDLPMAASSSVWSRAARGKSSGHVARYEGLQVVRRNSALQIPPGSLAKAKLTSGATNGLVKASLVEPLTFNGEVLLESGTSVVGSGSSTEERLNVNFTKAVLRDGTVQNIRAQACDPTDEMVGLKGSRVSRYGSALAAGIGLNFAGGLAQGLQENTTQGGVAVKKTDIGNAALNGASVASIETSKELLEKWKNQKTVIEVPSGTEICLVFSGE